MYFLYIMHSRTVPRGGGCNNEFTPPFLNKFLGITLSGKNEILSFKVFKICYRSVYSIVYAISAQFFTKAVPSDQPN